jgi:sec-independent protein translocase protein TatB
MFDISWTEFLLIGVVALIVIGPKELPAVMRSLGQWTRKIRSMAADFQNQFQEAMREAEMADLKKQVDDMAQDVTEGFTKLDPLKSVREDVESISKDLEKPVDRPAEPTSATQVAAEPAPLELKPDAAAVAAPALPQPDAAAPGVASPAPEPVTTEPASTERTG